MNRLAVSVQQARLPRSGPVHTLSSDLTAFDAESRRWLESLHGEGQTRREAIARLHDLLLRAARFEVARRRGSLAHLGSAELDDLAVQSADDALLAVLGKLDEFRGNSRFTTWAYKFALLETAVKLRCRPWQAREIPVEPAGWTQLAHLAPPLEVEAEQADLLATVLSAIQTELSPHQREVLVAVAVSGVPIDVLAERLATTRGALYKTIHDARVKLRVRLMAEGHELDSPAPGSATMTDGNTDTVQMDSVLRRLLGPAGPELSCERCFELLDEYVELEVGAASADEAIHGMRAHLEGCSACREEHDSLLALLLSDSGGRGK